MILPIIIPLLSKAKRGLSIASSIITETYLSIGDSFSDSVFKDLKRSSVKPWGARTSENGDKTLSGGRINWSHSRSDWKQVIYSHGQNTTNGYLISPICKGNHFERAKTTLKMLLASWFLVCFLKKFRSLNAKNLGSVGQRASNLPAIKLWEWFDPVWSRTRAARFECGRGWKADFFFRPPTLIVSNFEAL